MSAYELYANDTKSESMYASALNNKYRTQESERLRQKILECFRVKNEFHKSLDERGIKRSEQTGTIRKNKLRNRKAWKAAVKEWLDFRRKTEPDFESWHVKEGLPSEKRVEIFVKAMKEKGLDFYGALEYCGYPQLSNKEKKSIRDKAPENLKLQIDPNEVLVPTPDEDDDDDSETLSYSSMPPLIPVSSTIPEQSVVMCRNCSGNHWTVTCSSVNKNNPLPSLAEAKTQYERAQERFRSAEQEVKKAKETLAKVIAQEESHLQQYKKLIE